MARVRVYISFIIIFIAVTTSSAALPDNETVIFKATILNQDPSVNKTPNPNNASYDKSNASHFAFTPNFTTAKPKLGTTTPPNTVPHFRFHSEDLEESIDKKVERTVWSKEEEDQPEELGELYAWLLLTTIAVVLHKQYTKCDALHVFIVIIMMLRSLL